MLQKYIPKVHLMDPFSWSLQCNAFARALYEAFGNHQEASVKQVNIEKRYSEEKIVFVVDHSNNIACKATIVTRVSIPLTFRSCPSQLPKILCSVTLFGVLCTKHLGSISVFVLVSLASKLKSVAFHRTAFQ